MTKTKSTIKTVRVIRDSSDASKDYELPLSRAKDLYAAGRISYDETNRCYCHNTNSRYDSKFW